MSWLRSVLGSNEASAQPSGAETVARLCDRVQSSTLLDDRRDAVRALKSLSKKFRLEVGTQCMDVLLGVLQTDRNDSEIASYAVETLLNVIAPIVEEEDEEFQQVDVEAKERENRVLSEQFIDIFLKKTDNVSLLLSLLEEYEFRVRWPAIRLMTALINFRSSQVQQSILVSPMGVSKLMDLLSDSREVIRNDGLLLLTGLTKGNANIQKIVAFENAFDLLLRIIMEEGASDGGIVVEDCLMLLLNLLKKNSSNQTFFKEGSFVQRLSPFFDLQTMIPQNQDGTWSTQKVQNVHFMLQVVRSLVSPNNPQQATSGCQKLIHSCGLLKQLCGILMASGVPADILTETINTVSEVIRGCKVNQDFFAAVNAPSSPPRPAIVVLLMSMVNEKQPFILRCAVLYCFQCFLYKNDVGQEQIISTLLPATADVSAVTAGQLLCGGLFSQDPLSNWCASIALSHALKDNNVQKEQLLRVQLATGMGQAPVSLLQQCANILSQPTVKFQTKVGLLILLSSWLAGCQLAVTHFLLNPANIPFLTAQVAETTDEHESLGQGLCAFLLGICVNFNDNSNSSFTKDSMKQLIEKRIGLEAFVEKLDMVSKHEMYTLAAQKPQLRFTSADSMMLDYEFTALFKQLEGVVMRAVGENEDLETKKSIEDHDGIVTQYKDIIREQDMELGNLRTKNTDLEKEQRKAEALLGEQAQQIQQLKDQYALIKAQQGVQAGQGDIPNSMDPTGLNQEADAEKTAQLEATIEELRNQTAAMTTQLLEKESRIEKLTNDLTISDAKAVLSSSEMENISSDELKTRLEETQMENEKLRTALTELNEDMRGKRQELERLTEEERFSRTSFAETKSDLESKLLQTETNCASFSAENERLKSANQDLESSLREAQNSQQGGSGDAEEVNKLKEVISRLEQKKDSLESECKKLKEEVEKVGKEQDDLLVLLTDTDAKKDKYKEKLQELGQAISDDDLGDEEGEDWEEEEDDDEAS
ncbi:general vesicular transport factor p115-like isoform X2 [Asterias rubens]|uniref:general vesicular transport factor p115-like isoform X2 n=1 Tax=Asterias rubens TaxID=7604 RepID=UPI0014555A5E|nr:general vesicular transport factor p115-like isoform X2 [Asterias rubens]